MAVPSVVAYATVTSDADAGSSVTVNSTALPSVALASAMVSVGTPGLPVTSAEAAPSPGAPVRVAITRTVYTVPSVSPGMLYLVVEPDEMIASRLSVAASAKVSAPDFHCTL